MKSKSIIPISQAKRMYREAATIIASLPTTGVAHAAPTAIVLPAVQPHTSIRDDTEGPFEGNDSGLDADTKHGEPVEEEQNTGDDIPSVLRRCYWSSLP